MTEPEVVVTRKGSKRIQEGLPWIYRSDLAKEPKLPGGEVVRVLDERKWMMGKAFYSSKSKIALRMLSREDAVVDAAFFAERLKQARELRERLFPGSGVYRALHAEADLIPGLVVDRYGDFVVMQLLNQAVEARRAMWVELLRELYRPQALVERSDVKVRALEGLELTKGVLHGELPASVEMQEGAVRLQLDLLGGQKTGTFLDQRENHLAAANYAHGDALDCFSYGGGFGLQLAGKCSKVTAVEISEAAAGLIKANAERNALTNIEVITANAFDFLKDRSEEGPQFDTIVLDPPSFAKSKAALPAAIRGYKEINLRAIQLLRPGGMLVTASCSYHVSEQAFEDLLADAAADAKRSVQIIEKRGASRDHPVLLSLRETRYLKCFVLRAA